MTQPRSYLLWMGLFSLAVLLGCGAIAVPLATAFMANPWFNGVIVLLLIVGGVVTVRQVLSLYPEIAWVEHWRSNLRSHQDLPQPRLLASMKLLLEGRGDVSLSTTSMRTLLDTIRTRLEESRDLSRYLVGVLVFLGLLGTFWGLMGTVGSVAAVIRGMSVEGAEGAAIFNTLKDNLEVPLRGMGIAFSSSLFGLAGSLVLGFLDLQAGHAQNRFVNELEEWLSSSTRLSSGLVAEEGQISSAPAYLEALLEKTADALEKMQRAGRADDAGRDQLRTQLGQLNDTLGQFRQALREQNDNLGRIADEQTELTQALRQVAEQDGYDTLSDDLRMELRLLNKTLANALAGRSS